MGEMGIKIKNIYDRNVHLPKTKNGDALNMPLTIKALELLDSIQHDEPKLTPQKENPFKLMGERRKQKAGLLDIHFYDTRHEALNLL